MENIEEQILSYPHLSVEKKREVETYVEAHPEWASLLQDVRSIEALVDDIHADPSDALLTTYVVVQHLHPEEASAELKEAFRDFENRMEENPELRKNVEDARRRLETAEEAVDPVAHFEELTGHSLDSEAAEATAPTSSEAREATPSSESTASLRSFVDELLRLPLAVRWAGATVAVLLATYAALFMASEVSQSPLNRLAAVNGTSKVVDSYTPTTRSAGSSADTVSVDQLYVEALTAVRNARTSTFGLFPSYDPNKLDRAENLLTQVLDREESGSFLALEAQFYLGKVKLAQGQVEPARSHFKTVVQREGRKAVEASSILKTLQKKYPGGNSGQ